MWETLACPRKPIVVAPSPRRARLSATSWTAARLAFLSLTICQSLPKFMLLHRCCPPVLSFSDTFFSFCSQSFPASGTFPMSLLFTSGTKILELQLHHRSFQRVSSVQLLSCVQLFATPWTAARQASLSKEYSALISLKIDWFAKLSDITKWRLLIQNVFTFSMHTINEHIH